MVQRWFVYACGMVSIFAMGCTTESGAADGAGGTGQGGNGTGGTEQVDTDPGTVGNICKEDGTCDENLICAASGYCQPAETELPYNIVQAVPTPDAGAIPSAAPILLFADYVYSNVEFTVTAYTSDGVSDLTDDCVIQTLISGADKDIYVISSLSGFPLASSVVVDITGDFEGTLVFNIGAEELPSATSELGFEGEQVGECSSGSGDFGGLPASWAGFGDVGVIAATGSMSPTEGSNLVALTSGSLICGDALAETSSIVVSGPIAKDASSITFDYNFQSSEFDDYCNSAYDDTFLVVAVGPEGAVAEVVDSVNLVCAEGNHQDGTFTSETPDGGDMVYKETGALSHTLSGLNIGSPVRLAFVVTDVGDSILSSVVGVDNIEFE